MYFLLFTCNRGHFPIGEGVYDPRGDESDISRNTIPSKKGTLRAFGKHPGSCMLPFLSLLFIKHYELEPDFPCLPWYAQQIRTAEGHCSGRTDVSTTYAWGRGGLRVGGSGNEDRSLLSGAVPGFLGGVN